MTLVTNVTMTSENKYLNVMSVLNQTHFVFCNVNELRDLVLAVFKFDEKKQKSLFENLNFDFGFTEEQLQAEDLLRLDFELVKNLCLFVYLVLEPFKKKNNCDRHIVVTWSKNPVVFSKFNYEESKIEFCEFIEVSEIAKEEIVDTKGCGDGKFYL